MAPGKGTLMPDNAGEREKLSLSYQGRKEGQEAQATGENKDQLFLSLQDKFPVPQCLSETLTAEVGGAQGERERENPQRQNVTTSMVGLKTVTNAKISPRMVNP